MLARLFLWDSYGPNCFHAFLCTYVMFGFSVCSIYYISSVEQDYSYFCSWPVKLNHDAGALGEHFRSVAITEI